MLFLVEILPGVPKVAVAAARLAQEAGGLWSRLSRVGPALQCVRQVSTTPGLYIM